MIHLDRSHHHDLDQTQKQNLILSRDHDAPHFDWDDLSHTADNPSSFFHDALHAQQPLSPHNIHLPLDSSTSPPRQQHDLHDDKSSSLSPAPDSGSPPPPQNTAPLPPPQTLSVPSATDKQELDLTVEGTLTPLTELSPAPDLDDAPEDSKDSADEPKDPSLPNPSSISQDDPRRLQPTVHINGISSPPTSSASSPSRQLPTADILSSRLNGVPGTAGPSHSRTSSGEFLVPPLPSGLSAPASGHSSSDTKIVRVLEINAELFKVCVEFQLRGIPLSDSRFQQYAARLQVNLTWLAAAADQRHNNPSITLPAMEPPIAVDFVSMDRIHLLYSDMSTIFAKDFARRQLLNASHQGSPVAPSAAPNGALKRARPDDLPDLASKRRDMGEKKVHVTQAPPSVAPLSSAASHHNPQSNLSPPGQSNIAMSAAPIMPQSPRMSSPAMAPPSATPSLPFGAAEASIAASTRARARELQIQHAREQHLRQAAQMQQMQAGRHMSPPSASPQATQVVPGAGQSNAAFGPQAQQLSILQNPNHPLMQYMIQQMPQFLSLPPQQQLQKLQMVQTALAQRQQQQQQLQNPQMATPQRNPQMAGMAPNASMSTMSNGALGTSVPSPMSPLVQQSPVMSQPQQQPQQVMNQPAQNGMYSFGPGQANPGMDPRMAGSNYSSQMSGGMPNNMNMNQQRQLMLMQQQQQMRNASGNMNAVPNMMNSQHAFAMAQRMAQAGPSQPSSGVGGSPMSAPAGDQFPALRSNSTIPGIARSARSPSDGLHSPMTPRAPSRLSQQSQLQQNDYSQAMMQHPHAAMTQNPGTFNPQMQNLNWPQNGQQPMQPQMGMVAGQMNGYSMNSPNSAGMGGGFFGSTPSPSNSNWQQHQQGMAGGYPFGQSMGQHPSADQSRLSHMTGMSIPQNMSPMTDGSGTPGEYEIFNYNGS